VWFCKYEHWHVQVWFYVINHTNTNSSIKKLLFKLAILHSFSDSQSSALIVCWHGRRVPLDTRPGDTSALSKHNPVLKENILKTFLNMRKWYSLNDIANITYRVWLLSPLSSCTDCPLHSEDIAIVSSGESQTDSEPRNRANLPMLLNDLEHPGHSCTSHYLL
jgi:hypothetical protein